MRPDLLSIRRRALLAAPLALAAGCGAPRSSASPAPGGPVPQFKDVAPFPIGACAMSDQMQDPQFAQLLRSNFSQITPEWEMKMEAILQKDGSLDFALPDAIAKVASDNGQRLHGHTLIWHEQQPQSLKRLSGAAFGAAYRDYILQVAGRYRGRVSGWDVVNEPVRNDGGGYYDSVYSDNLGEAHIADAFFLAREADPEAVLFLNDYNLEHLPEKRRLFLALAERLLKAGAPLQGLGTQTHLATSTRPGAVTEAIGDLASLGLQIHVSELDVSTEMGRTAGIAMDERLRRQAELVRETVEAFTALPAAQRYALTVWGVRDKDAWKARPPNDGKDQPLLFDREGRPKPSARAFAAALAAAK